MTTITPSLHGGDQQRGRVARIVVDMRVQIAVKQRAVQPSDMEILANLTKQGKQVSVMVDNPRQLNILNETGKKFGLTLNACLEVDMAFRPLGSDALHLGLRRSPIRTPEQAIELVRYAGTLSNMKIDSVMGYEGHIAGTNDDVPHKALDNIIKRALKNASVRELSHRRAAVIGSLRSEGVDLRPVNGGGSGRLVSTSKDESVTEATIGSGLYASGLFHHFKEIKYQPSAFFALQVVRKPKVGMVTNCAGGGYIASGAIEKSKLPLPVMPVGLKYVDLEGAGEVQTPLVLPDDSPEIELGDPIFFQIQLQYVDSGGTAYDSTSQTLGTEYARQLNILTNNPATATAWTPAEPNSLKTGVKVSV